MKRLHEYPFVQGLMTVWQYLIPIVLATAAGIVLFCVWVFNDTKPNYPALPVFCMARAYQDTVIVNVEGEPIALFDEGTETVLIGINRDREYYIVIENSVLGYLWADAAVASEGDCMRRLTRYNVILPFIASEMLTP